VKKTYELLRFPRAVAAAAPPSAPPTGGDEVYRGGAQQRLADGSDTEHPTDPMVLRTMSYHWLELRWWPVIHHAPKPSSAFGSHRTRPPALSPA